MDDNFDKFEPLTAASLMRSIYAPDYPPHIRRLLEQIKGWLPRTYRIDDVDLPYWEAVRDDPDRFFSKLDWLESEAALLPALTPPPAQPEAVVLCLGEADLTGAMRLAVDYSLIFSKNMCRRVWIVSDCWIPFDVLEYSDHIRAMSEQGISLRFLIVSLWGWVEMPISSIGQKQFPGSSASDGGSGRNRRRRDDD